MKMTDGLFHKIFDEIAAEYPDIENEHWIVDIGAAKMADTPEAFDVIVMPNLYGDILSDVAAQIAGSVGLAGSANIGEQCAMFEAIHGSAPRRAGQNLANPVGPAAGRRADAGAHRPARSRRARAQRVAAHHRRRHPHLRHFQRRRQQAEGRHQGIRAAVVARIGERPATLHAVTYNPRAAMNLALRERGPQPHKALVGVDVYVDWNGALPDSLATMMAPHAGDGLELTTISSRGTKVWPGGFPRRSASTIGAAASFRAAGEPSNTRPSQRCSSA